jgi:hypothetical protein
VAFLNRAAAAAAQNDPLPRPDQVSYAEQLIVAPGPHGGVRECLVTWTPSPLTGLAGGVGGGKCGPGVPAMPSALAQMRSPAHPSYLYPALNTLPTSPAALRTALYAAAAKGGAAWDLPSVHSTDVVVVILVGRLLGVPLSGPLRAGLYELLAQMAGVTLVPNAMDAADRHGAGIIIKRNYRGTDWGPRRRSSRRAPTRCSAGRTSCPGSVLAPPSWAKDSSPCPSLTDLSFCHNRFASPGNYATTLRNCPGATSLSGGRHPRR